MSVKLKKFKEVIERDYVKTEYLQVKIGYKIFNDQLQIDLKRVYDAILGENNIQKYDLRKLNLNIPVSVDKTVTGNSISVVIDKKRFTLSIGNTEIIPSKQQKIDYDNTHPHRWKIPQWIKFINHLYYEYYGIEATELTSNTQERKGRLIVKIKSLIDRIIAIKDFDTDCESVVEYLRWVFHNKSSKLSLTTALICSDTMIQDWAISKAKDNKTKRFNSNSKKRKWDE